MLVGFRCGAIWQEVGDADYLHAFFSTICVKLENGVWGSRYPMIQKKLYYEKLEIEDMDKGIIELLEIQKQFQSLTLKDLVWDYDDLTKPIPVEYKHLNFEASLNEALILTSENKIVAELMDTMEFCKRRNRTLFIQTEKEFLK